MPISSPSRIQYKENEVKVKVSQLCPTLCDPRAYRVHEILQDRILECVAFPFSRGFSQPRDRTQVSLQADSLPAEPQGSPEYNYPPNVLLSHYLLLIFRNLSLLFTQFFIILFPFVFGFCMS